MPQPLQNKRVNELELVRDVKSFVTGDAALHGHREFLKRRFRVSVGSCVGCNLFKVFMDQSGQFPKPDT